MSKIRLIAIDLDGTLFTDDKKLTQGNLSALRAALDKGVDVMPATGRTAEGIPSEFLNLPGVRYALTSNGARVVELATGRTLVSQTFDPALVPAVYDLIAEERSSVSVFSGGSSYSDRYSAGEGLAFYGEELRPYIKISCEVVDDMGAWLRAHPDDVEKFSNMYPDEAAQQRVWRKVKERFPDVEAASSLPRNLEISAPGVNKGSGLMLLAEKLGLARDEVMAIGDSGNDLAMIREAGLGVAMGNSTPDVLAAADYVTLDNNHDGVAAAIQKLVLDA